ncbi:MAG TPA: site-2 protease family protein [Terriglobales bacterium]|nr:site-2 protease family protein [Terriglobales bacterium]
MSGFFIAVLAVAVVLGFMILIHEFGHYAVAKLLGVRVEVFSIGFGKRLLGFRRGDTDYRISAIPLGGYVKMSGENPMDERTGDPGEFLSHPRWHRFLIAIAGPSMNILLAIGLLTFVYMVHYEYPAVLDEPAVIGWVSPDTPAAKAGIQIGDRIARLDGIENPTWKQVDPKEALSPNQPLDVTIERGGKSFEKTIVPEAYGVNQMGYAGWVPKEPSVTVTELEKGMPAEKAGIRVGDEILTVDGQPIPAIDAMIETLKRTQGKPVEITVRRDGQERTFTLQPVLADVPGQQEKRYRVGLGSLPMKVSTLPLAAAFRKSIEQNKEGSLLILELVQKMIQRKISIRTIEGPIGIGRAAGEAATEKGWTPLMALTAAISLNLGIFNLLPIPILDGGVILLLFVESIIRRDISLQIKERIYQAAFVFLVLFAVMVIYNDLAKTLPGMMQRLP